MSTFVVAVSSDSRLVAGRLTRRRATGTAAYRCRDSHTPPRRVTGRVGTPISSGCRDSSSALLSVSIMRIARSSGAERPRSSPTLSMSRRLYWRPAADTSTFASAARPASDNSA